MRPELDIHKVNSTISSLKALDLKTATTDQIHDLLRGVYSHIGIVRKLNKGEFIQRGVSLGTEEEYPKLIQRISFNPNGSPMGRCNLEDDSIFYGCIASNVIEGYNTAAFELLPLTDEETKNLSSIRQHRMVIGNWILSEETEFLTVGFEKNLVHPNTHARNRNEIFNEAIRPYQKSILSYYAIDKFLAYEFSKPVPKDEPWQYKISAVYVDLLRKHGHKGLIYPSVKSSGAGMNIIIFPEYVKNGLITFDRCAYTVFYVREKEQGNEWLMHADAQEENLVWKDDYNRMPTPLRNYYKGISELNPSEGKINMLDLGKPAIS